MKLQPILIDGEWRQDRAPEGSFRASNPAVGELLAEEYPVSCFAEIETALEAGHRAIEALRLMGPEPVAHFLEAFAGNIEARRADLVQTANLETALPEEPRLNSVELPRTTGQLRQAAAAVRDRS